MLQNDSQDAKIMT